MSELDPYLDQTLRCAREGFYYPALAMALALPDICSGLAGLAGGHRQRYEEWLDQVGTIMAVHPEWIWRVRCAFLHDAATVLGRDRDLGRIVVIDPPKGLVHSTIGSAGPGKFGTITIEVRRRTICDSAKCTLTVEHLPDYTATAIRSPRTARVATDGKLCRSPNLSLPVMDRGGCPSR